MGVSNIFLVLIVHLMNGKEKKVPVDVLESLMPQLLYHYIPKFLKRYVKTFYSHNKRTA